MKKLLLSLFISLLSFSCSKTEADLNLASVVDDKELAEELVGKWSFTLQGKGSKFYTETISFDRNSPYMSKSVAINEYETILDTKTSTYTYKISIREKIMTLESGDTGLTEYHRIEHSKNGLQFFERPNRDDARKELPGKKYVKGR